MKKIFFTIMVVLLTISYGFSFTVNVNPTIPTIKEKGRVADIEISEDVENEFSSLQKIIISVDGAFLLNSIDEYNVTSGTLFSGSYTANGQNSTNRIEITVSTSDDNILEGLKLVNIFVVPYIEKGDINFKISFFTIEGSYSETVTVATKPKKENFYTSYYTNYGKWWTGIVIINNTLEDKEIPITFHTNEGIVVITYTIEAKNYLVLPIYNEENLANTYGWFEFPIEENIRCITLIGDGTQSYSF